MAQMELSKNANNNPIGEIMEELFPHDMVDLVLKPGTILTIDTPFNLNWERLNTGETLVITKAFFQSMEDPWSGDDKLLPIQTLNFEFYCIERQYTRSVDLSIWQWLSGWRRFISNMHCRRQEFELNYE